MRFAFVITNLNGGGAEKAIMNIARHLVLVGHEVRILVFEELTDYFLPDELSIEFLYPEKREISKGWLSKRLIAHRLSKALSGWNADLVVSTLPFADEVAILARLPRHCSRIANTLSAEIGRLGQDKAERRLRRYQTMYGQRPLIAVSEGVARDLRDNLGIASPIRVIANPFDVTSIRVAAQEDCLALPSQPYVIHVGRFSGQKRHDLLLDAWSEVSSDYLLVLLAHPEPALQHLIDERGLSDRVIIAGFQKNPYPWIAKASLLVLSSDHEGLPNVLVEALICGTPVVSTDCPSGPREILGDKLPSALLPCGDPLALASAINSSLRSPHDISLVDLARFDVVHAVEAYEDLAREMARYS